MGRQFKFYQHPRCSTCKKAAAFLDSLEIDYKAIDITAKTPTLAELKKAFAALKNMRKLFNTSGERYRELGLKDAFADLSEEKAFQLLMSDGMLIKRPFLIGDGIALMGFQEPIWEKVLSS